MKKVLLCGSDIDIDDLLALLKQKYAATSSTIPVDTLTSLQKQSDQSGESPILVINLEPHSLQDRPNTDLTVGKIFQVVCTYFEREEMEVAKGNRKGNAPLLRRITFYFATTFKLGSQREISSYLNRERSAISTAMKIINTMTTKDATFKKQIEEIGELLKSG